MKHFLSTLLCCVSFLTTASVALPEPPQHGKVLLQDAFDRDESDPTKEEVGNGWGTNSASRAKGVKQVDLVDGAMHIVRADVADHGVSVTHEVAFKDATIELRFQLGPQDDLGINIADMHEKSVHAGHICMARVTPSYVEILDLKTGNMKLEHRAARKANTVTEETLKLINSKKKRFKTRISPNEWHDLSVQIIGETLTLTIDGRQVAEFQSVGIGHPTKSRLRLAVNKSAWVDDVKVLSHD